MNSTEFSRLSGYSYAKHFAPRQAKPITSRRAAKMASNRTQGRRLIWMDKVFLKGEYKK